jgi:hypothetical protein
VVWTTALDFSPPSPPSSPGPLPPPLPPVLPLPMAPPPLPPWAPGACLPASFEHDIDYHGHDIQEGGHLLPSEDAGACASWCSSMNAPYFTLVGTRCYCKSSALGRQHSLTVISGHTPCWSCFDESLGVQALAAVVGVSDECHGVVNDWPADPRLGPLLRMVLGSDFQLCNTLMSDLERLSIQTGVVSGEL